MGRLHRSTREPLRGTVQHMHATHFLSPPPSTYTCSVLRLPLALSSYHSAIAGALPPSLPPSLALGNKGCLQPRGVVVLRYSHVGDGNLPAQTIYEPPYIYTHKISPVARLGGHVNEKIAI